MDDIVVETTQGQQQNIHHHHYHHHQPLHHEQQHVKTTDDHTCSSEYSIHMNESPSPIVTPPSPSPSPSSPSTTITTTHIILFYKYHRLSNDVQQMRIYQNALQTLCTSLQLTGRILIGISNQSEGINGTLAGSYSNVLAFTHALLYYTFDQIPNDSEPYHYDNDDTISLTDRIRRKSAIQQFWKDSKSFFTLIQQQPSELRMTSPEDFKWSTTSTSTSTTSSNDHIFPDLYIKLVNELIGTGCIEFAQIPIEETAIGYLTPQEWHEQLVSLSTQQLQLQQQQQQQQQCTNDTGTMIIDCRNTKEYQIGHFQNAINPNTTTFAQFITWVQQNQLLLSNQKNIYMYCTGGIRCEKASAYIRRTIIQQHQQQHVVSNMNDTTGSNNDTDIDTVPPKQLPSLYHLKGGIHKYLEQYGTGTINNHNHSHTHGNSNSNTNSEITGKNTIPIWKGRNYVFDGRNAILPSSIIHPSIPLTINHEITNHINNDDNNNNDDSIYHADATSMTTSSINSSSPSPSSPPSSSIQHKDIACTEASNISSMIVGQCLYCQNPYDQFDPNCVCTVCREPILICQQCQLQLQQKQKQNHCSNNTTTNIDNNTNNNNNAYYVEYHCSNHIHLQNCYYTNLNIFNINQLQEQKNELIYQMNQIAIGRRYKQKRKTLLKQIIRIQDTITELQNMLSTTTSIECSSSTESSKHCAVSCRNCNRIDCIDGRCWGFYGLQRKSQLANKKQQLNAYGATTVSIESDLNQHSQEKSWSLPLQQNVPLCQQQSNIIECSKTKKKRRNDAAIHEIIQLNMSLSSSSYRDNITGIRVPPCCTRIIQCTMKAKWCGQNIMKVLQHEFTELAKPNVLNDVLSNGLLRLNGKPISLQDITTMSLKGSDILGRIIHWHEAPVIVPIKIDVQRVTVPANILKAYGADSDDDGTIYICNKPSSVPTHPAGPYTSNTLTMMVEGQESLQPQSLFPLHRTDRVTSGLTLCTTSVALSRAFHKCMIDDNVDKLYLAKVNGNFPSSSDRMVDCTWKHNDVGRFEWCNYGNFIMVDAPIYTLDAAAGIRSIDKLGKPSKSYFKHLYYDEESNTSVVVCCPRTGRNHQLRVHLHALGYPIINDIQYCGRQVHDESGQIHEQSAVDVMLQARDSTTSSGELRVSSLSDDDVKAAKRACQCCRYDGNQGIISSFTQAQLLMEGHTICLHAFRYRIRIAQPKMAPKQMNRNATAETSPLTEFDFKVSFPIWVDESRISHNISWFDSN
jgi:predicted sulfurtransferase/23S rRNA-/tRNA-specific pseudouridylate synthase